MKRILTFLFLFILATSAIGQKFSIGSEVGIISSINTNYNLTDYQNRRNTYYAGININYQVVSSLSFTTGLHYVRQGYRHATCYISENGEGIDLVGKFDYLSIPVIANVHLLKSQKLILSIGLLGEYNLKAVQDYPQAHGGCEIYYIPDLSDFTEEYSFSAIAGIGYKVLEKDKFELITALKYYHGLTNSFQLSQPDIHISIDRRYSSVLMTLSFNYKL
ncbi:MAG: PorT family protein [Saprospiraceae bacterium]|nr:PorT family protein [Candidatus Opimibacter skivensis]